MKSEMAEVLREKWPGLRLPSPGGHMPRFALVAFLSNSATWLLDRASHEHQVPVDGVSVSDAPLESRVSCPCCGCPTLDQAAAYDTCRLCHWGDDGHGDNDADNRPKRA